MRRAAAFCFTALLINPCVSLAQDSTDAVLQNASGGLVISAIPLNEAAANATITTIAAVVPEIAPSNNNFQIQPRRSGAPEPSIILGELAGLLAADKRGATGVPRAIRDRIRELDAELFSTLLGGGRFDPVQDQYAAALQTELAAQNCYNGGIDGVWGQGSIAALGRYFTTLGQAQAATTPGPDLFRQVAAADTVTCPAVRTATPSPQLSTTRRSTATASTPARSRSTQRSTQAAPQRQTNAQPAVQQPQSKERVINPNFGGSGVFR